MRHFLLFYETASDYLARRSQWRAEHLAYAEAAVARGELMLGGALADPADRAVLLFKCEDADLVYSFAQGDPYVRNGLITHWQVREWSTVVGADAAVKLSGSERSFDPS